jgi:MFS family permease
MYGYDSAFIGGTMSLPSFQRKFGLATATAAERASLSANIVSTFQAGAFFGALLGYGVAERWGRRCVLYVGAVIFMIGVILQMIGIISLLYVGRALTGIAVGSSTMTLPIYIGECEYILSKRACLEFVLDIAAPEINLHR